MPELSKGLRLRALPELEGDVSLWAVRAQHFPAQLCTWLCSRLRLLETRRTTTTEVLPANKLAPCLQYVPSLFICSPGKKMNRRVIKKSYRTQWKQHLAVKILQASCLVTLADVSLNLAPARWLETTLLWNNYTMHVFGVISRNHIK